MMTILHFYEHCIRYTSTHAQHIEQKYFIDALVSENVQHLPKSVTNEYSAKER